MHFCDNCGEGGRLRPTDEESWIYACEECWEIYKSNGYKWDIVELIERGGET